jgi:DNA primase catalytic subunit
VSDGFYIWISDDGRVHALGEPDREMIGHYLRILADELDSIPQHVQRISYVGDLLELSRLQS